MKIRVLMCAWLCLLAAITAAKAQPLVSVDFNLRTSDPATATQSGFSPFLIASNGTASLAQTGSISRIYGPYTVTLSGSGSNPGYVDRQRTAPSDSGDFTQSLLLRDFVFSSDAGSGGLNVTVDGLTSGQYYKVTIWSFDSVSLRPRYSDWTANGILVKSGYVSDNTTVFTNNQQGNFSFKTYVSGTQIAIQGRRVAPTAANDVAVFLNALQVEPTSPDAPSNAVITAASRYFAGDNVVFTAQASGTAPFTYHWLRNGTLVGFSTVSSVALTNAQPADSDVYSVIVSNSAGTAASSTVQVTVEPVQDITTGLLAYWPLDALNGLAVDATTNANGLWPTNLDAASLEGGARGFAPVFNGTDRFLMRTNAPGSVLPAYQYPAYTVALWVKGIGTGQGDRRVFCESSSLGNNPLMTIGTDNAGTNNEVDIFVRFDNGGNPLNHRKSSLLAFDGSWHHIAWVDNNGFAKVYVDGAADTNSFNYTRGTITANTECVGVVYRTNAQALFNGSIDEVTLWRRSLTPAEIQQVMQSGPLLPSRILSTVVSPWDVTVTFTSATPNATHHIQTTTDLSTSPIVWTDDNTAVFSSSGNVVSATIERPPGQQVFVRVRD